MSVPRSVRFDDDVVRRIDRYVRTHPGSSVSSVTNRFVDEALRMADHPGIHFRPGPTGRRAGLVAGPDVWEVAATVDSVRREDPDLDGDETVTAVAEALGLPESRVRVATGYWAAHREEIDEWVRANNEVADEAEARWRAEQRLLRRADPPAS